MLHLLKRQFTLATISGIPIRVDHRWSLVLIVMAGITTASILPLMNSLAGSLVLGVATTILFFASIFLHEYAHAVVARREGLRVVEIVLHPFGGLARFAHPPQSSRSEFWIAIAGPAASFALAIMFAILVGTSTYLGTDILTVVLSLLALTNLMVAVFNLLPGYPLDGGRILRAYLWKQGKDVNEATVLTGRCGQAIGIALIAMGLAFAIIRGEVFAGFWSVIVGIFLFDSATAIIREVSAEENVAVKAVMMLPTPLDPTLTIQRFIDEILPMNRQTAFPVAERGQFLGLLVLDDARNIAAEHWRSTTIRQAMRQRSDEHFVHVENSIADARILVESNGVGAVAVVSGGGQLVGVVQASTLRKRT